MAKKEAKEKETAKKVGKNKSPKQKTKKNTKKVKSETYMEGVNEELKKVKWPSKQEVIKYSVATIVFVLILVVFFLLLNAGMAGIKEVFNK